MFIRSGKATGSILVRDLNKPEREEAPVPVEPEPVPEPEAEPEVEVADEQQVESVEPEPDMGWLRDDLDRYAANMPGGGIDTTDLPSKAAVLQAIRDNTTE